MSGPDLSKIGQNAVFRVESPENDADRNARIANGNRRARNDEFLRLATYVVAAIAVSVIFVLSVYTIFFNTQAAPENRTYAIDALKMLTPAVIAFILGRTTGAR